MRWFKKDLWKAAIAIAGILLLLVLMMWIPVSAAGAREGASGFTASVTITLQATPTEDTTVTALNKEKLAQEVQQLKNQNEPDSLGWLRSNASILLSTLIVVIGALFGSWQWSVGRRDAQNKELEDRKAERERRDEEQQRWLKDQEAEREKRAEESFQSVVEGLGSEREEARVSAAINLRTFLLPGYERFYSRVFGLTVAHLRLPRTSKQPEDQNIPLEPTALSQALSLVFKEAFPLARSQERSSPNTNLRTDWYTTWYQSLDARGVQLDNAYLGGSADLERVWMPKASLRKADLWWINFKEAYLCEADLSGAELNMADLSGADLSGAELNMADLSGADLSGAFLQDTDFRGAKLFDVNLSEAHLVRANFSEADLSRVNFNGAELSGAKLEDALSLKDSDLHGVKGLSKDQLATCKAKGAFVDEEPPTNSPQLARNPARSRERSPMFASWDLRSKKCCGP